LRMIELLLSTWTSDNRPGPASDLHPSSMDALGGEEWARSERQLRTIDAVHAKRETCWFPSSRSTRQWRLLRHWGCRELAYRSNVGPYQYTEVDYCWQRRGDAYKFEV